MSRTAKQVRRDTGGSVETIARVFVTSATQRWGGETLAGLARRTDVAPDVMRRALDRLTRKGELIAGPDPATGETVWSVAR